MNSNRIKNASAGASLPSGMEPGGELQRGVEHTLAPSLQKLPPQDRQHVIQEVTMMVGMSGPLPPPAIARQYEELCPGFIDRSLKIAETAQQAEIDAASDERQKNQNYRMFGMGCAVLITLTLIAAGVYIAVNLNVYAGIATSLITFVAGAIATFINGRPLADGATDSKTRPRNRRRRKGGRSSVSPLVPSLGASLWPPLE